MPPPLLGLTPGTLRAPGRGGSDRLITLLERAVRAACAGGLGGLLLREPHLEDGLMLELCQRVSVAAREAGARWVGVHDRLHIAAAVGADGAHLGGSSLAPEAARRVLGAGVALGASTHAGDDLTSPGVDYAFHSPIFRPASKPGGTRATLGVEGFLACAAQSTVPLWALGGMDAQRAEELVAQARGAPIGGIALIGGLFGTDDRPIDGAQRSVLQDADAIEARARSLCSALSPIFETP